LTFVNHSYTSFSYSNHIVSWYYTINIFVQYAQFSTKNSDKADTCSLIS